MSDKKLLGWKLKTQGILNNPIHKKINLDKVPKPYLEVAQGMETQFINQMLGEMRKNVTQETPDSSAVDYYKSLQDYERSKIMAENNNGIGIKELILKDLVPQHILDRATATNTPKTKAMENYKQVANPVMGSKGELK